MRRGRGGCRGVSGSLEEAAESGDREAVYPLLAPDVEWVTPKRTLRGIDEIREELTRSLPPENLDLEFQADDWVDLGDRRLACDVHQVYRWKETDDVSYERDRRIELTIRDGKIGRYEMRIVG
jgi:ketosteroid isomerase-like protein